MVLDLLFCQLINSVRGYEDVVVDTSCVPTRHHVVVRHSLNDGRDDDLWWWEYFNNLSSQWDNRLNKRNVKVPNFKHKLTKQVLQIEGWYTPHWVKTRFRIGQKGVNANIPSVDCKVRQRHKFGQIVGLLLSSRDIVDRNVIILNLLANKVILYTYMLCS